MTPEAKARRLIDKKLELAGWTMQDMKQLNLAAATGVAIRGYPTDTGPADYVLFVNRNPVGIIEAKRDEAGENFTVHEPQTERYAHAALKWCGQSRPLPFLFESTGQIIRFTDGRDPAPRSREIFHFFRPEQLADWGGQPEILRCLLAERMPELSGRNLRDCQISAVTGLEQSLAMKTAVETEIFPSREQTCSIQTMLDQSLKQSSAQRQNILKAAFSGQLVPQDPNDEPASVLLERIRAERTSQVGNDTKQGRKPKGAP